MAGVIPACAAFLARGSAFRGMVWHAGVSAAEKALLIVQNILPASLNLGKGAGSRASGVSGAICSLWITAVLANIPLIVALPIVVFKLLGFRISPRRLFFGIELEAPQAMQDMVRKKLRRVSWALVAVLVYLLVWTSASVAILLRVSAAAGPEAWCAVF
mmetsp:Transcript_48790/g.109753  ORF Transcript_48790/g.109753 Transcript_48790/m.109753 type:complete len:159 (+) Transcript_48790:3-479(+)